MEKIIFLTHDGYRLPTARVRCYNFAKHLQKRGISCEVISYVDHLNGKYDGDQRYRLSDTGRIILNIKALARLFRERNYIFYIQKAGYHFLAPFILTYLNDVKFILDYDDYELGANPFRTLSVLPFLNSRNITLYMALKSSAVVASSRYLERLFLKVKKNNVYYLPTGVDANVFDISENDFAKKDEKIIFSWQELFGVSRFSIMFFFL